MSYERASRDGTASRTARIASELAQIPSPALANTANTTLMLLSVSLRSSHPTGSACNGTALVADPTQVQFSASFF